MTRSNRATMPWTRRRTVFCRSRSREKSYSQPWCSGARPQAPAAEGGRRYTSVVAYISATTERLEKAEALDPVLQLVADLVGARDQIIDLQELLLLLHVDIERHDQRVGQCFEADRLNLGHRHLIGQVLEILPRKLRQPRPLRV